MMKKILLSLIGITIFSIGLNLMLIANIGVGSYDTLTLVVQQVFNIEQFGNASLLLHMFFALILTILSFRNKKKLIEIILSVFSIFVVTRFVNIFSIIGDLDVITNINPIINFILGLIIVPIGLLILSKLNLVIAPFDKTVVETSIYLKIKLGIIRVSYDFAVLVIAYILTFILGLNIAFTIGTLIITFGVGIMMQLYYELYIKTLEIIRK